MSLHASIIVCGRDPQLVETRRWILEQSGANVLTAADPAELAAIGPQEPVDLIILCHSLSAEQCDRAISVCATRWPQAQSLLLVQGQGGRDRAGSDAIFDTTRGPALLLQAVTVLVAHEQATSRQ
jgi:CheY-like chemotaxis protein